MSAFKRLLLLAALLGTARAWAASTIVGTPQIQSLDALSPYSAGSLVTVSVTVQNLTTNAEEGRLHLALAPVSYAACWTSLPNAIRADVWHYAKDAGGLGSVSSPLAGSNDNNWPFGGYRSFSGAGPRQQTLLFTLRLPSTLTAGGSYVFHLATNDYYLGVGDAGADSTYCAGFTVGIPPAYAAVQGHVEGPAANGELQLLSFDYSLLNISGQELKVVLPACMSILQTAPLPGGGSPSVAGSSITWALPNADASAATPYQASGKLWALVQLGGCSGTLSWTPEVHASGGSGGAGNTVSQLVGSSGLSISKLALNGSGQPASSLNNGDTVTYVLNYSASVAGLKCFDSFDGLSAGSSFANGPANWSHGANGGAWKAVAEPNGGNSLQNLNDLANYNELLFDCPAAKANGEDVCGGVMILADVRIDGGAANGDAVVILRSNGQAATLASYYAMLSVDPNPNGNLMVQRQNGASVSWPAGVTLAVPSMPVRGVWYTIRAMEQPLGTIRLKHWRRGDPEPTGWEVVYTDPSPLPCGSAGDGTVWKPGLGGANDLMSYDNFCVFSAGTLSGLQVWDTIPAGIDFQSASPAANGSVPSGTGLNEGMLRWDFTGSNYGATGGLFYGGSGSFTWTGVADCLETAGPVINTASVKATGLSAVSSNSVSSSLNCAAATPTPSPNLTSAGTSTPTRTPSMTPTPSPNLTSAGTSTPTRTPSMTPTRTMTGFTTNSPSPTPTAMPVCTSVVFEGFELGMIGNYTYADSDSGCTLSTVSGAHSGAAAARYSVTTGASGSWGAGGGFNSQYGQLGAYTPVDASGAQFLRFWIRSNASIDYRPTLVEQNVPVAWPAMDPSNETWLAPTLVVPGDNAWHMIDIDLSTFTENMGNASCTGAGGGCAATGNNVLDKNAIWAIDFLFNLNGVAVNATVDVDDISFEGLACGSPTPSPTFTASPFTAGTASPTRTPSKTPTATPTQTGPAGSPTVTPTALPPNCGWFYTTNGSWSNVKPANNVIFARFVLTQPAVSYVLVFDVTSGAAGNVQAAIFDNVGFNPSAMQLSTAQQACVPGLNSFSLSGSLPAGTYWAALWSDTALSLHWSYDAGYYGAAAGPFASMPSSVSPVGAGGSYPPYMGVMACGAGAMPIASSTPSNTQTSTPTFAALGSGTTTPTRTATGFPGGSATRTPSKTPTATPTVTPSITRTPTSCGACSPSPTFSPTTTWNLTVAPDLLVDSSFITQYPLGLCSSSPLGLLVRVRNQGNALPGTFVVEVDGVQQSVSGMVGPTVDVWFSGIASMGTHNITVDLFNAVAELNESNNTASPNLPIPTPLPTCVPGTPTATPTMTLGGVPPMSFSATPTLTACVCVITSTPTPSRTWTTPGGSPTITITATPSITACGGCSASFTPTPTGFIPGNSPTPTPSRTLVPGCVSTPPLPGMCPAVYIPVCGCNGITYSNGCYAAQAGVLVVSNGPCGSTPTKTPPPVPGGGAPGSYPFPNPAKGKIQIAIQSPASGNASIQILNSRGLLVATVRYPVVAGQSFVPVSLARLGRGIYFYQVRLDLDDGRTLYLPVKTFVVLR